MVIVTKYSCTHQTADTAADNSHGCVVVTTNVINQCRTVRGQQRPQYKRDCVDKKEIEQKHRYCVVKHYVYIVFTDNSRIVGARGDCEIEYILICIIWQFMKMQFSSLSTIVSSNMIKFDVAEIIIKIRIWQLCVM